MFHQKSISNDGMTDMNLCSPLTNIIFDQGRSWGVKGGQADPGATPGFEVSKNFVIPDGKQG